VLVDTAGTYRPSVGEEVEIDEDGTTRFKGTIDNMTECKHINGNGALQYTIKSVDFNQLCDRYTVAQDYEDKTLAYIVQDIVDTVLTGENITYTKVETGPTIAKAVFPYKTVTQCFNDLSDLTGMDWYIDYDKDLHFFARESNNAPADLTDSNNNFMTVEVKTSREQYRNRQYLRAGNDITDARTETFAGDGETKSFVLKYPVAKVPSSVTVDTGGGAVAKTIGIKDVETSKDFYWNKGQKEIIQDDSGTVLEETHTLSITYQGQFPIIVRADKEDAITDRATVEGGNGVYEAIEEDKSIESQDTAKDKAEALLRRYGDIPNKVVIVSDTSGFKAGQLVTVTVSAHNLNATYLIQQVQSTVIAKGQFRYTITALSGENIGGWVDFFKKLAQTGKTYVIRENEVLIRILAFSENITITDSLTVSAASPESRVSYAMIGFSEVS
jgi:hypothetical protein